jgi:TPR repeat protein
MSRLVELKSLEADKLSLSTEDCGASEKGFAAYKDKQYHEALELFESLANKGYVSYQLFVGWMYAQAIGTDQDDNKALYWYKLAADNGAREGIFYCGYVYLEKREYQKSNKYFEIAGSQNYSPAIYRLAVAYDLGLGVDKDTDKATDYYLRASSLGHVFAKREIAVRYFRSRNMLNKVKGLALFLHSVFRLISVSINNLYADELKR